LLKKTFLAWVFLCGGLSVFAQTMRVGPEFRVNTYTTSYQEQPRIARNGTGAFVVVWQSRLQDGSASGIYGRRYDAAGTALGPEFQVNTYTTGDQVSPAVALDSMGQFVVVWQSSLQDGSLNGIYAQRYNGSGAAVGSEFRVNAYTTSEQADPSVDYDGSGSFVVAWDSGCGGTYPCTGQDGEYAGIFAQRYTAAGAPSGTEFRVNTYTRDYQSYPVIGKADAGNFVVAWQSYQEGSGQGPFSYGITNQRYTSAGAKSGQDVQANSYTSGDQASPTLAVNGAGNFVVVWESATQDGSGYGIFAQRYNSAGTKQGSEFRVNTYTTGDQRAPSVAIDNAGNFTVVWRSTLQDGWASGVYGQRYDSSGVARGTEFRVNTYTAQDQRAPSVALDPATGNIVVVWSSAGQDGSFTGVYGQQFSSANCPAVSATSPANQTACPGASVIFTVSPSGLSPFTYQWARNNISIPDGGAVSGARTSTLRLTGVTTAMSGTYGCAVSDYCLPAATVTPTANLTVASNGQLPAAANNLKVQKVSGGASLKLTWNNSANATDYVVFQDASPHGSFGIVSGSSTSGLTGLTVSTPPGNMVNYLVSGRNTTCGIGP